MNKKRVLLASILKPVDDVRMYEKIALSLFETQRYEITTIGFTSQAIPTNSPIHFVPAFDFKRISWARLMAPWKVFKTAIQVKPELLIINTFELLIVSLVIRIIFGCEIYYDVQENYYRNIREGHTLPKWLSIAPALLVRGLEYVSRLWVSGYLLAERNYENEFDFSKSKSVVIENKFKRPSDFKTSKRTSSETLKLLYTGNVAESYGVMEAIQLAKSVAALQPINFHIVGHCASDALSNQLYALSKKHDWLSLHISAKPIPHPFILTAISEADFGLLSYRVNPSTENCIPTKLYEYMAYQLPIISVHNPLWQALINRYQAGFVWDFNTAANLDFIRLTEGSFYLHPPNGIWWDEEASKLIEFTKP